MFENIVNGISEFFSDVMPHTFCLTCFLEGFLEGAALGLLALAAIAAAPAWLAIGLTVGLLALGAYGMAQLAHNWDHMSDNAKNKALGNLAGGIVAGFAGPKIMPGSIPVPGVRFLSTPEGVLVPVLAVEEVAVSATAGQGAAAGLGGGGLAMMSGKGGGGEKDRTQQPSKEPNEPTRKPGEGVDVEAKWGNPKSTKAYGHSRSEHGATRSPVELQDRAAGTEVDQGQWLDDQLIVEAEQRAPLEPGEHVVEFGRPVGRVYRPDGSVVEGVTRARVIRKPDGTVRTSYPIAE